MCAPGPGQPRCLTAPALLGARGWVSLRAPASCAAEQGSHPLWALVSPTLLRGRGGSCSHQTCTAEACSATCPPLAAAWVLPLTESSLPAQSAVCPPVLTGPPWTKNVRLAPGITLAPTPAQQASTGWALVVQTPVANPGARCGPGHPPAAWAAGLGAGWCRPGAPFVWPRGAWQLPLPPPSLCPASSVS